MEYNPEPHASQVPEAEPVLYVPGTQLEQTDAEVAVEKKPAEQLEQADAPMTALKVPAPQD